MTVIVFHGVIWAELSSGNIAHKSGLITNGRALCLGPDSDRQVADA